MPGLDLNSAPVSLSAASNVEQQSKTWLGILEQIQVVCCTMDKPNHGVHIWISQCRMTSISHGAAQSGASIAGTMDCVATLCGEGAITSPQALLAVVQHRFEDQLSKEHVPRLWAALLDSSQGGCADDH